MWKIMFLLNEILSVNVADLWYFPYSLSPFQFGGFSHVTHKKLNPKHSLYGIFTYSWFIVW